ncbi:unnamed protein product [Nippostrongylus brasiliensis]|uniref:Axoneme-associated protein mst101(2)-like n=1 Tax=Nippostrongylus brasiliensis TaxID=27835 RepID=A0A0N4XIG1_NIPBR|nr:unnamed protein product [Nippostrongylus brasiliensis]
MEEIVEKGAIPPPSTKPVKEPSVQQKKLSCKFRKSCYETGVIPPIDSGLVAFFTKWWPSWEAEEEEVKEEKELGKPFDADEDLMTQKLLCKYRTSCYEERGIPLDEKQEEKRRALFAAKPVPKQPGKKKTLKEIAAIALKKVAEAEEKATKRPVVKVVEKRLNAAEEKRNEKLNCKYRKSCYETGEKPVIEDAWKLPVIAFATESAETVSQEINYDELEELQKKVYCKYRKSCYETGVKPHIEPEIFIKTLADLTTIHEQVETRKLTLQEKCKYRKSCYETGIVPEINPKLEAVIQKEVSSVIPTNAQDLRMLCKYRKSCYAEVHESATVDTIKKIRKRRQIEKEVRRRKARRIKLHRRLRGELQLGSYRSRHRAAQQEAEERSDENVENVAKMINVKVASAPKKGRKSVKEEESKVEKVSSNQPKAKKAKQQQKAEEEATDEPDSSAIEDETPLAKKQRKAKKSKEQKEEEVKVEKKVEKKAEKKAEKKEEPKMEKKKEKSKAEKKKEEPKESEKQPQQKTKKESQKTKDAEEEETKDKIEEKEKQEIEKEAAEGCHEKKRFNKAAEAMKKMVEEMHRQQEDLKIREHCKYRKSCYETGQRPVIDQSFHHLLQKFSEHVDREMEQQDSSELPKSEAQKKLECKYRKSCYETGVLPEIKVQVVPTEEQPIVFKAGVSKQLQCKYRKSCYEEAGIIAPKPEVNETEDKRAKLEKKPSQSARPSGDTKRDGGKTEGGAKKQVKLDGAAAASKDAADGKGGDSAQCKPGQSCYSSAPPRAMNEDHAGSMARTGEQRYRESGWCNPYYYSCREILGLPPKERAPIGPNGKRLCRKKPL